MWCHSLCSISVRVAEKIEKRYLGKAVHVQGCRRAPHTHLKKYFTQTTILCCHSSIINCVCSQLHLTTTGLSHPSSNMKLYAHSPNTHAMQPRQPSYNYITCSSDAMQLCMYTTHGFCMSKATNTSYTCTCMWVSVDVVCMWERGSEGVRVWNQTLPVYINSRFLCSSGLPMEYLPTYVTNRTDREGLVKHDKLLELCTIPFLRRQLWHATVVACHCLATQVTVQV